jgi:putative ABC transport system ATP-binding protein
VTPPRPAAPPRGSVVVGADQVSKAYGGQTVVDRVSLAVGAGELAVVVGRSGSGKSTLLMILGGWLQPDAGRVELPAGTDWASLGYVPQRFGLVPELSVLENVELPGRLIGRTTAGAELLARLGLEGHEQRGVTELSIGQQQRVAVARALALAPPALVVDEPTSHQDDASAELVWAELARAAAAGAACLVATHEPDATLRADRSWAMEAGRLEEGAGGEAARTRPPPAAT